MVFSQIQFLFYFLPCVLLVHQLIPAFLRNAWLVAASLLFYAWSSADEIWILGVSIVANYLFGSVIFAASRNAPTPTPKLTAAAAIVFNLLLLGYFKYANFLVAQSNAVLRWTGALPHLRSRILSTTRSTSRCFRS